MSDYKLLKNSGPWSYSIVNYYLTEIYTRNFFFKCHKDQICCRVVLEEILKCSIFEMHHTVLCCNVRTVLYMALFEGVSSFSLLLVCVNGNYVDNAPLKIRLYLLARISQRIGTVHSIV
jgi:hypothetical protein